MTDLPTPAPHEAHHPHRAASRPASGPRGGGASGSIVFGVAGFVLTIPMLLRLRRRFGTWIGVQASSRWTREGLGRGQGTLFDELGEIGLVTMGTILSAAAGLGYRPL